MCGVCVCVKATLGLQVGAPELLCVQMLLKETVQIFDKIKKCINNYFTTVYVSPTS